MNVTFFLVWFVVLVGLALAWRFYRWRWRPRLVPDDAPRRGDAGSAGPGPVPGLAPDWILQVRNEGAATARRCRATLLRLDVESEGRWSRIEPPADAVPMCWSDGSAVRDLAPGVSGGIVIVRGNGLKPGRYRFELAIIDGEERRKTFELTVEPQPGMGGRA